MLHVDDLRPTIQLSTSKAQPLFRTPLPRSLHSVLCNLAIWITFSILTSTALIAGPKEFGLAEFQRAVRDMGLPSLALNTQIVPGAAESYEISGNTIRASDSRGLMYGLLEAATQVRKDRRLSDEKQSPKVGMRGIRIFIHNADLDKDWYYSRDYWDEFFSMLAYDRFNRFNLVFAHQTDYLAPPYPFWVALPEFPEIRARNLSAAQREKNLEMLQYISQDAADHGIDFTLGVWEHNIQSYRKPPMIPMTEGLNRQNIGPYSYAALKKVLQLCPAIVSVQIRTNVESGIPNDQQVDFYRNYIFRAIHDAGRPVILDLRGWIVAGGMLKAAAEIGIPVRLSTKYWAEDMGRPYQPAETYANYSYLNFLQKPRSYGFYWEIWGLGSNRLLLWGSPEYVKRAVSTFSLGGAEGFEIDPPLAQKGFGNAPGKWSVFTEAQSRRMFWKWEFQRYWLFYRLWGRLSYDPEASERTWMDDMKARFGKAASDVMYAYENASKVINEIVAVHLADPNMYIWPEINPGGLVDSYRVVLPSDWRYVASIPEAVHNRLAGIASAKQTAPETAEEFDHIADLIDKALDSARSKITENREWLSTEPDFRVLSLMARYHARKQLAAYHLELFDMTADSDSLALAHKEVEDGLEIWQRLVRFTDGLYPQQMAFGPDDNGDWKDKLPYVRYDIQLVRERQAIFDRFGRFAAAFDFGGPVKSQPNPNAYRQDQYVLQNNVEPRFTPVDAGTIYEEKRGYGWLTAGPREAVPIDLIPYLEVRAVAKDPQHLPQDVLFRDYIRGRGPEKFGVRLKSGTYTVDFLHPDHTTSQLTLETVNDRLEIPFPNGEWSISGLIVKPRSANAPVPPPPLATRLPRPELSHRAPVQAQAGQPLTLNLQIANAAHINRVRLYYRPVNQLASFKMIEKPVGEAFTVPGNDISSSWDLMYYFEVLNDRKGGWFQPDPSIATPYYVVKTIGKR